MSKVKVAKTAGFCKGVRNAVEKAITIAKKSGRETVTLGPIIHNPQVLEQLSSLGIKVIKDPKDGVGKNVVVRAHGIPPSTRSELKSINACICDATCSDVGKVQGIIKKYTLKGYTTIIVGDEGHAEVKGLMGFAEPSGFVISKPEEIPKLPDFKKVCVVAQTTQQKDIFDKSCELIKQRYGAENCIIFDTVCPATIERQEEVYHIAKSVDLMVVIGGKESANTARLAQISEQTGTKTILVETEKDMENTDFSAYQKIGVTAGASTPNWLIKQIVLRIKKMQGEKKNFIIRGLINIWNFMRVTNLLVAFAAGCLNYSVCYMQNISSRKEYFFVSFFYILAIYSIKNIQRKSFLKLNEPSKLEFYEKNKFFIMLMIAVSVLIVLKISLSFGIVPFIVSILLFLLGVSYHLASVPFLDNGVIKIKKVSQIPGSKDLIVISGWAVMVIFLPILFSGGKLMAFSEITALLFVVALVSIRSIVNDIREIQEDMMVGAETLPIYMGKNQAMKIIKFLVICASSMLIFSSFMNYIPSIGFFLLIPLWSMYLFSLNNEILKYSSNLNFADVMDFHLITAGIISYIQNLIK